VDEEEPRTRYIDNPGPDWWPDDDEEHTRAEDLMIAGPQVREELGMSLAEFGEARQAGTLHDRGDGLVTVMSDLADEVIDQSIAPDGAFSEEQAAALAADLGEPRLTALFTSYRPARRPPRRAPAS